MKHLDGAIENRHPVQSYAKKACTILWSPKQNTTKTQGSFKCSKKSSTRLHFPSCNGVRVGNIAERSLKISQEPKQAPAITLRHEFGVKRLEEISWLPLDYHWGETKANDQRNKQHARSDEQRKPLVPEAQGERGYIWGKYMYFSL